MHALLDAGVPARGTRLPVDQIAISEQNRRQQKREGAKDEVESGSGLGGAERWISLAT